MALYTSANHRDSVKWTSTLISSRINDDNKANHRDLSFLICRTKLSPLTPVSLERTFNFLNASTLDLVWKSRGLLCAIGAILYIVSGICMTCVGRMLPRTLCRDRQDDIDSYLHTNSGMFSRQVNWTQEMLFYKKHVDSAYKFWCGTEYKMGLPPHVCIDGGSRSNFRLRAVVALVECQLPSSGRKFICGSAVHDFHVAKLMVSFIHLSSIPALV